MAEKKIEVLSRKDLRDLAVVGGGSDIIDWELYDTLTIPTAGTQVSFKYFQQSVGPNGITLEQTNMDIPAQLPNGVRFVVQEILAQPVLGVGMTKADLVDLYKVSHQGILTLNIGTRSYFQVPILNCIGGVLQGFAATAVGAANLETVYAGPRSLVSGKLEYSPVLPSTFNFNATLDYPTAPLPTVAVKFRIALKGKLIRPRQG